MRCRGALEKDDGRRVVRILHPRQNLLHPSELQGHPPTEKEALLRKLVALLEEEAEVINQKVMSSLFSPFLRIGIVAWFAGELKQNLHSHWMVRWGEGGIRLLGRVD